MILYLVRHGLPEGAVGRWVGHANLPLSAEGRLSVARLAAGWSPPRPRRIVSSDLARARDSAVIFATVWGVPPECVSEDARLREMHFGQWDGRGRAEVERSEGPKMSRWMERWTDMPAPEGESFDDVRRRVVEWLGTIRGAESEEGDRLVVAHAGSIRAILCHTLGLPLKQAFGLRVDHARLTILRLPDAAVANDVAARGELLLLNADRPPCGTSLASDAAESGADRPTSH